MQRPRVLVVDDDDGTLQAIAAVLRRDFAVWVARDATQAIAVAPRRTACVTATVIPRSLNEPVGFSPSCLKKIPLRS